jgi:hypothetical protein
MFIVFYDTYFCLTNSVNYITVEISIGITGGLLKIIQKNTNEIPFYVLKDCINTYYILLYIYIYLV